MKFILIFVIAFTARASPQQSQLVNGRHLFGIPSSQNGILGGIVDHVLGVGFGYRPGDIYGSGFGGNGFPYYPNGGSSSCRYWCFTPRRQAYCCETPNQRPGPVGVKPGLCPPVRPQCPPTRFLNGPIICSNDWSCTNIDKCCFDTCLQQHVCKPPLAIG